MKYLMMALAALALTGCLNKEANLDCIGCTTHLENGASTVDCDTCTFKYDGEMKESNIIDISLPSLPSRPGE